MPGTVADAARLALEGSLALARMEANGMRVDVPHLESQIESAEKGIKALESSLRSDPIFNGPWRKRFGSKANLDSHDQLGMVLYSDMGHTPTGFTETGRVKTDEAALTRIDLPFVKDYLKLAKLKKVKSTYLNGIKRELVNGYVHPVINLHTTVTSRSSFNSPNLQNVPVRNKELSNLVRSCFVPRPGNHLVEIDYGGIEVRIAACYHKDPTMLTYINDPSKDMHRDMAMECYILTKEELGSTAKRLPGAMVRYISKNMFVFPQFYGSYYVDCARHMWDAIDQYSLMTGNNTPLKDHLKKKGIKGSGKCVPGEKPRPGTFEAHIKAVEDRFWNQRFPVYTSWKKRWWAEYQRKGSFQTLVGFPMVWGKTGLMGRNDCLNYAVQSSAFHCLLQSIVWIQEWLTKKRKKTLLTCQIHDSLIADVPPEELQEYLTVARKIMTKRLVKEWDWINVPLIVEAEVCDVDRPWSEKREWVKKNGLWNPK